MLTLYSYLTILRKREQAVFAAERQSLRQINHKYSLRIFKTQLSTRSSFYAFFSINDLNTVIYRLILIANDCICRALKTIPTAKEESSLPISP